MIAARWAKLLKLIKKPTSWMWFGVILAILGLMFYLWANPGLKPQVETVMIKLYYYDSTRSENYDYDWGALTPIEVVVPASKSIIQDTIRLLLSGKLGPAEEERGLFSEVYNPDFKLLGAGFKAGVLTLTFNEVPGFTSGGTAHITIMLMQLEKTAKQFPEVKKVVFKPDDLFEP